MAKLAHHDRATLARTTGPVVRTGAMIQGVIGAALIAVAAGCATPSHPVLTEQVRTQTKTIAHTTLQENLTAPPRTLAEAEQAPREPRRREPPPERIGFDIAEVRKAVIEHNLGLKVQLTRPSITREQLAAEHAKFEPSAFAQPSITRNKPDPANPLSVGLPSTSGSGDVGLRLPLRTGGTAQVRLGSTAQSVETPGGASDVFDSSLGFSISQPLMRGGGVEVNTASITVTELQHTQEEARTKAAIIGILAGAETTYWRHYAAERALEVRYQQYERALEQERQAARLAEAGVVPAIEVVRAQAGVSRRLESIIVAENARRQTQRELKRVMNRPDLDMYSPTAVITATEPRPVQLEIDAEQLAIDAMENRMELLDLELQLAIDAVTVDVARNQELPVLNVDYSYAYLGASSVSFNRSLDTVLDRDFSDWRLGVTLELPLGNRAAKAQRRRAMLQRALTLSTRTDREQLIRQEVLNTVDNLSEAWQRILAARQETLFAGRAYEGERRLFSSGVRTSTDVLQALDFLADAQVREIQALAGYEVAKIDVAIATGSLLGYGSIRLRPYAPHGPAPDIAPYGIELRAAAPADPAPEPLSPALLEEVATIVERHRAGVHATADPPPSPTPVPGSSPTPTSQAQADASDVAAPSPATAGAPGGGLDPAPQAREAEPGPVPSISAHEARGGGETTPRAGSTLRGADPALYTVQVMSGVDEHAVKAFIGRSRLERGELAYFESEVEGRTRYAVVYGLYPTVTAARMAADRLPAEIRRGGPWVRRLGSIQSVMSD